MKKLGMILAALLLLMTVTAALANAQESLMCDDWEAIPYGSNSLATGNYCLKNVKDLDYTGKSLEFIIRDRTVKLCLHGKAYIWNKVTIKKGAKLELYDCVGGGCIAPTMEGYYGLSDNPHLYKDTLVIEENGELVMHDDTKILARGDGEGEFTFSDCIAVNNKGGKVIMHDNSSLIAPGTNGKGMNNFNGRVELHDNAMMKAEGEGGIAAYSTATYGEEAELVMSGNSQAVAEGDNGYGVVSYGGEFSLGTNAMVKATGEGGIGVYNYRNSLSVLSGKVVSEGKNGIGVYNYSESATVHQTGGSIEAMGEGGIGVKCEVLDNARDLDRSYFSQYGDAKIKAADIGVFNSVGGRFSMSERASIESNNIGVLNDAGLFQVNIMSPSGATLYRAFFSMTDNTSVKGGVIGVKNVDNASFDMSGSAVIEGGDRGVLSRLSASGRTNGQENHSLFFVNGETLIKAKNANSIGVEAEPGTFEIAAGRIEGKKKSVSGVTQSASITPGSGEIDGTYGGKYVVVGPVSPSAAGTDDLPETGDPSSLMGWAVLLAASGAGLKLRRKK